MSAHERSGWRDEALSLRHREWGDNVPMVDIDWLGLEYDSATPKVIIDYKRRLDPDAAADVNLEEASYRALRFLADSCDVPFMIVFYTDEPAWRFSVQPGNPAARRWYQPRRSLTEGVFVSSLYKLRGRTMPDAISQRLTKPTLAVVPALRPSRDPLHKPCESCGAAVIGGGSLCSYHAAVASGRYPAGTLERL